MRFRSISSLAAFLVLVLLAVACTSDEQADAPLGAVDVAEAAGEPVGSSGGDSAAPSSDGVDGQDEASPAPATRIEDVDGDAVDTDETASAAPTSSDAGAIDALECSFSPNDPTSVVLSSLASDLRGVGEATLADDVEALSVDLDRAEPTAESLVETMRVLPEVAAVLAGRTDAECLEIFESAVGRLGGFVTAEGSADAIALAAADDDLASVLERGFRLPADDAACVASELETAGADINDIGDIDVLVALSSCANQ